MDADQRDEDFVVHQNESRGLQLVYIFEQLHILCTRIRRE